MKNAAVAAATYARIDPPSRNDTIYDIATVAWRTTARRCTCYWRGYRLGSPPAQRRPKMRLNPYIQFCTGSPRIDRRLAKMRDRKMTERTAELEKRQGRAAKGRRARDRLPSSGPVAAVRSVIFRSCVLITPHDPVLRFTTVFSSVEN